MKPLTLSIVVLGLTTVLAGAAADIASRRLPRSTPESQGVSSVALREFVEALDRLDAMHSFMLVRRGHVIAEGWWDPYAAGDKQELYSLSKSFASTAVGFAVAEGRLSIDDEVLKFFPADAPAEVSANLKAMRVRDLLTMCTGHQDEPSSAPDKISPRAFLAHPVPHKPGTHFKYNTAATFMLGAIVEKLTAQGLVEYLRPRLFEPLGIERPFWATNSQGTALGGYGLRVRTEDIACFGQLYLQRGRWGDRQLLPAAWVDLATSRQVSNGSNPRSDWDQGYGFQFWRCRHEAYRGDGAFGQYCVVLPRQDAVIVITSAVKDMQAVLNLIWDKLLPAFQPKRLKSDRHAHQALVDMLERLRLPPVPDQRTAPLDARIVDRKFVFPPNDQHIEAITLRNPPADVASFGATLVWQVKGVEYEIPCGRSLWLRSWLPQQAPLGANPREPVATSAGWTADDTYTVKLAFYETPHMLTLRLKFDDDRLHLDAEANVAFGPTKRPPLVGRAE